MFRLRVPAELGLVELGVPALLLYVSERDVFCRVLSPRPSGPIHAWSADQTLAYATTPRSKARGLTPAWRAFVAWIDVVCAALWHDLRVAGDAAVRAMHSARRRRGRGEQAAVNSPPPAASSDLPHAPVTRVLTVPRLLSLRGEYEWGTEVERTYARTALRYRTGHPRRLPTGWKRSLEAESAARAYGVVLPEGYTFVRPFTREGGDQPQVVEVHSRGLASLLALGVRVSRRGGNPSTRSQLH